MRIENSSVTMASKSTYVEKNTKEESLKTWIGDKRPDFEGNNKQAPQTEQFAIPIDLLDISEEGKKALQSQAKMLADSVENDGSTVYEMPDKDKQKLILIQKMLEALTGKKIKFVVLDKIKLNKAFKGTSLDAQPIDGRGASPSQQKQGWGLEYELHQAHYEKQDMSFAAKGVVKTADGKEISFDVQMSMSREFASQQDISIREGDAVKIDPLVINFGSAALNLTNEKFKFDLDNNGTAEQISFVSQGSGFLSLDLNNDGKINNGSELFGPKSGNGFAELAKYDGDQNGWIDENDSIYDKLRIWVKDENGNDKLFALGQKGIGAIYLGNAETAFDLKNNQNQLQGNISKTGIFLMESGSAGTVQHVNLAV
jgi:hypothetical protein